MMAETPLNENQTSTQSNYRYRCKYCNRNLSSSSSLRRHIRGIHLRSKPHSCHLCDYVSAQRSNLRRHYLLKHPGQRVNIVENQDNEHDYQASDELEESDHSSADQQSSPHETSKPVEESAPLKGKAYSTLQNRALAPAIASNQLVMPKARPAKRKSDNSPAELRPRTDGSNQAWTKSTRAFKDSTASIGMLIQAAKNDRPSPQMDTQESVLSKLKRRKKISPPPNLLSHPNSTPAHQTSKRNSPLQNPKPIITVIHDRVKPEQAPNTTSSMDYSRIKSQSLPSPLQHQSSSSTHSSIMQACMQPSSYMMPMTAQMSGMTAMNPQTPGCYYVMMPMQYPMQGQFPSYMGMPHQPTMPVPHQGSVQQAMTPYQYPATNSQHSGIPQTQMQPMQSPRTTAVNPQQVPGPSQQPTFQPTTYLMQQQPYAFPIQANPSHAQHPQSSSNPPSATSPILKKPVPSFPNQYLGTMTPYHHSAMQKTM